MDLNIKWYKSDEAKKFLESSAYKQRLYDVAYGMAGKPIKLVEPQNRFLSLKKERKSSYRIVKKISR